MTIQHRTILKHSKYIIISFIVYFCLDYFVQLTNYLKCYSFVGLKSFLPITLGLNFGLYGAIGEVIAILLTSYLLKAEIEFVLTEIIITIVLTIGSWFLWHIQSYTHRIHFRYAENYIRYIIITISLSLISGIIGIFMINTIAFEEITIWVISMTMLVGFPIDIIYAGLMNLEPVLPPVYQDGKKIEIVDDIKYTLDKNTNTIQILNDKIEELLLKNNVKPRRVFEVQSIAEELYLKVIADNKDAVIDVKANYDIVFSFEYIYIGKKYNPFYLKKDEEEFGIVGLKILKHMALLAFFSYAYGENTIHVVV